MAPFWPLHVVEALFPVPSGESTKANDLFDYTFNAADSLTQVSWQHGVLEDYTYDGDGLRIRKVTGSDEVVYIRDPAGNVLAEYDAGNNLLAEYVYANGHQVSKVEPDGGGGDSFHFFHSDHLGTALVITDENGTPTWRGEYFPFGEEYSSEGTPSRYRFVERELDQTTGLSYMRGRYYNPHLGRFLSVDPVGGDVANSQSWNRYSYVLNNPLAFVDPNGEETYVVVHGRGYADTDLRGYNVGGLFRHSAKTRATEIRESSGFDSTTDAVVVVPVGNETEFAEAVNADYPSGALKSIDVFSHGYEGGINFGEGGIGDSAKRMDIMEVNQLNPTMAPDASAQLYGCRTGLGNPSMAQAMANQLGVPVSGSTGPTWFTNPNPTPENPAVYQVPQGGQVVTFTPEPVP